MSFTAHRRQEIDAELGQIHEYLLALALEIDHLAQGKDRRGRTYESAMDAAGQIFHLRERLRQDQQKEGQLRSLA